MWERKLKSDDTQQDVEPKNDNPGRLFVLLIVETTITFAPSFLRAMHTFDFGPDEWSFELLATVIVVQIIVTLTAAVNCLFLRRVYKGELYLIYQGI